MLSKWPCCALFLACALALFVPLSADRLRAQEPSPSFDPEQVPIPQRPPFSGLAAQSYAQNCAPCHGPAGDGDGPAGAAADPTVFSDPSSVWDRSPAELFFVTKFGRIENLMPPWRNSMSDEQIWQAVYYSWSLHTTETEIAEGAELYAQSCRACHGADGRGDGSGATGEMPDFAAQAPMIFASQAELDQRWRDSHPQLGSDWSMSQRKAVLEYVRAFTYEPIWAPFSLSGSGVISGEVVQGTEDGSALRPMEVMLNVYQQTNLVETRTAMTEAEGGFAFQNLPLDEGFYFLVETSYRDVRYTSPILAFSGPDFTEDRVGPDRIDTSLPVYETTTAPHGIQVSRANWIIEHEAGALLVGQLFTFGNASDRTFVGTKEETLDWPVTLAIGLPADAQGVEVQDGLIGEDYILRQQTLYDTRPVRPGDGARQTFVRYRLPFADDSAEVSFPVSYDIQLLNVLVADLPGLEADLALAGEPLEPGGQETIQGVSFRRWSAPVSSGLPLQVRLRRLIPAGGLDPRAEREPQTNRQMPIAAPPLDTRVPLAVGGIVTLILLAAILLFVQRERNRRPPTAAQITARRAELIDQIARLDDLHALGELEENAWKRERENLKQELIAIALTQNRASETE